MRRFLCFGNAAENLLEIACVLAVIGGQALADQEHFRFCVNRRVDNGGQVVAQRGHRQAAKPVVTTECNDHNDGSVFGDQGGDARTTATGGFAGNAGIDDAIIGFLFLQAFLQERWPRGFLANAIAGRERIAQDQDVARGQKRRRQAGR